MATKPIAQGESLTAPKVTQKHRDALSSVIDQFDGKPFRRGDLATWIHPLTKPRSWPLADMLASLVLKEAVTAGQVSQNGEAYVPSAAVNGSRPLIGGGVAAEFKREQKLDIGTKCPGKWVSIDLETGDIWMGTELGWRQANAEQRRRAEAALKKAA
ncbi:hypothetical protein ABIC83_002423 [Roseateles asaccharophilus]|uniref:hypothetical protein n=1 Tax=Roseateles asaccharophilus TaxID=582607 RepID=UPI0038384278